MLSATGAPASIDNWEGKSFPNHHWLQPPFTLLRRATEEAAVADQPWRVVLWLLPGHGSPRLALVATISSHTMFGFVVQKAGADQASQLPRRHLPWPAFCQIMGISSVAVGWARLHLPVRLSFWVCEDFSLQMGQQACFLSRCGRLYEGWLGTCF